MAVRTNNRIDLELVETTFRTPREVLAALKESKENGWELEINESLVKAVEKICEKTGFKESRITLDRAIEIVGSLPETALDKEIEVLEETETQEAETKMESRALNASELKELVAEYEEATGKKKERIAKRLEQTGIKIDDFIQRQREIGQQLSETTGISENKIEKIASDLVIEEKLLEKEIRTVLPDEKAGILSRKTTEMVVTEVAKEIEVVQKEKIVSKVAEGLKEVKIEGGTQATIRQLVTDEVVERVAEIKMTVESSRIAEEMVERLKEEGILIPERRVDEGRLAEVIEDRVSQNWEGKLADLNETISMGRIETAEGVKELVSGGLVAEVAELAMVDDERSLAKISQIVKEGEEMGREVSRKNPELVQEFRMAGLRKEIRETVIRTDPTIPLETVREYSRTVSSFYRIPLDDYRETAIKTVEKEYGPGRAKVAWGYTEAYLGMLTDPEIEQKTERLNSILDRYPRLEGLTNGIEKVRTVNGLVRTLQDSGVMREFLGSQKLTSVTGFIDSPFSFVGQKLMTSEGVRAFVGKIGGQELVSGLTNIFAKGGGTGEMLLTAGKSILAKLGGTAVGSAAAGGAAAAGGTAVAAATGPPGWIAAAVIAGAGLVKKILGKVGGFIGGLFESLGIDRKALDVLGGAKSWMRNNLGGIIGGVGGLVLDVVQLPLMIVGGLGTVAVGTTAVAIVPVVIVGLFIYQVFFQTPLVSSLVPPKDKGGDISVLPDWNPNLPIPEGCPDGFPTSSGIITQGPGGSFSHTNGNAIDLALLPGTTVWTTHDGVAIAAYDGGYGNYVRVRGKCNGVEYDTIYAHLITPLFSGVKEIRGGMPIGLSGSSGNSTGPHLHYEIKGNLPERMEFYLRFNKSLQGCNDNCPQR